MSWYFRTVEPRYDFSWIAWHHFFYGILIMGLGFVGIFQIWPLWVVVSLFVLGLWILIDDVVQHIIQRKEISSFYMKQRNTEDSYYEFPTQRGYYTTVTFWHWMPYLVLDWVKNK